MVSPGECEVGDVCLSVSFFCFFLCFVADNTSDMQWHVNFVRSSLLLNDTKCSCGEWSGGSIRSHSVLHGEE